MLCETAASPHDPRSAKRPLLSTIPPPFPVVPPFPPPPPPALHSIASPWRRLGAFAIDGILIGIVSSIVCIPFFDTLAALGAWGRLIGLLVAVLYFGLMESTVCKGQSLGKVLLGLQVVDRMGRPLRLEDAILRSFIFSLPFFLNQLPLPMSRTPDFVIYLLGAVVFGLGGSTLYLLIFNKQTGQGVHDLAVRSYVVSAMEEGPVERPAIWKTHWVFLAVGMVCISVAVAFGTWAVRKPDGRLSAILTDLQLLEKLPNVQRAGVFYGWNKSFSSDQTKRYLTVNVFCNRVPNDESGLADTVASVILRNDPHADEQDSLSIVITRGYDLGISSAWKSNRIVHTPEEWRERLSLTRPASPAH